MRVFCSDMISGYYRRPIGGDAYLTPTASNDGSGYTTASGKSKLLSYDERVLLRHDIRVQVAGLGDSERIPDARCSDSKR